MSNADQDRIASIVKQINLRLPDLEESAVSIIDKIPSNLSCRLFRIQSSLSDIDKKIKHKSISPSRIKSLPADEPPIKSTDAITINDDHNVQIEKYRSYLKKHLNNAIQKHFSDLDDKMKKLESDYPPNPNSNIQTAMSDSLTDLESKITKSFNDFSVKYQDLYSKISNSQVQKKFTYEKAVNYLSRSLDAQIKQQHNDIEILKVKMDETQKLLNKVNTEKNSQNGKTNQNVSLSPEQNEKRIIQEQEKKIDFLNSQWSKVSESLQKNLSAIDKNFDDLLQSTENIQNSMEIHSQKISEILLDRERADEDFYSIQERINDENYVIEQSSLKGNISRFKLKATLSLEEDKNQIEVLENYVNQLYDRLTEFYGA